MVVSDPKVQNVAIRLARHIRCRRGDYRDPEIREPPAYRERDQEDQGPGAGNRPCGGIPR